ncbi:hypothetical protein DEO72_LG2g3971 [Vigna unguiculata]|uniref:Uncharacterized protein n=1 Tax=Vigna unguiculata TaxID=3917 RepID=A0A4D6L592_VIGUN|nr:hypothetical protein DEO72_LG2g3971 [Vigna unguiculata]
MWLIKVGEDEVHGAYEVYEVQAEICEEQIHGEVGEMDGVRGGMKVDGCEEDQVGEMDGQVEGMEAEESEVEVHVCEVQVEAVEVEVGDKGTEVEAHEETAEVEVGDANGLNRDNVEGLGHVDMDLNATSDVEVEGDTEVEVMSENVYTRQMCIRDSDEVQSLRDEGFGDDKDERGRGGIIERTHKLIFSVQLWRLHYGVEVLQGEGLSPICVIHLITNLLIHNNSQV